MGYTDESKRKDNKMIDYKTESILTRGVETCFRVLEDEVIAIFPTLPGDMNPNTCLSYLHVGQHT